MNWKLKRWQVGATVLKAGRGGIARVARLTARALLQDGVDTDLLTLLDDVPEEIAGKRTLTTRGNRLAYTAHCHTAALSHDRFVYDAVGVARAHPRLLGLRRPYGVWIHGVEVWHGLSAERERALRGADFVLVNSRFTLNRFEDLHWPLENAYVCHLATENDDVPKCNSKSDGPPTALLIGRSDKRNFHKGHKEVIESWTRVTQAIPQAQLLLVGGGDGLDLLRETVACSPVRDQIRVMDFVPEEDMPSIWARAHVFAQPSWKEGFGLVYIEAMRHGLPVIASLHDAGQEVNLDGETGYNVNLMDSKALSDRLITLLRDRQLAYRMGQVGQARWQQHFCFDAFRRRFTEILDHVDDRRVSVED